jgi:hypothetical protein
MLRQYLLVFLLMAGLVNATNYYFNSSGGSDANDCLSAETTCRTLAKVESLALSAGDNVYFSHDSVYRLVDNESSFFDGGGDSSGNITYGCYGSCIFNMTTGQYQIPTFMGSINASSTSDWFDEGGNIWRYNTRTITRWVGLILVNGTSALLGENNKTLLNAQGEFAYNSSSDRVWIYSTSNPASYYNSIELGTGTSDYTFFLLDGYDYIHLDRLHLKLTAFHAISTTNNDYMYFTNLLVNYTGGAWQPGQESAGVRYGNGISINNANTNILIDNCRLSEVYDGAITVESFSTGKTVKNITVTNNIVDRSEYNMQLYSTVSAPQGVQDNFQVNHNTFIDQGAGWGSQQRSNKVASVPRGMFFWNSPVTTTNVNFTDNIVYGDIYRLMELSTNWQGDNPIQDYNLYYGPAAEFRYDGTSYSTVSDLQTGKSVELHSEESDPEFVGYQPGTGNVACTMSSTGSYVGALPCYVTEEEPEPAYITPHLYFIGYSLRFRGGGLRI